MRINENKEYIIRELIQTLQAKADGMHKNLICRCPICGKEGKYGIYIGRETSHKKPFMSNCFSCGFSTQTLDRLLDIIGRPKLKPTATINLLAKLDVTALLKKDDEEELDMELKSCPMPEGYKRVYTHPYTKSRGFIYDDYEYFPVGCTDGWNRKFENYVIFPILQENKPAGYVARHFWGKTTIDNHNRRAKQTGEYRILRYRNSTENDFIKLLYNYDMIDQGFTDTVILVEGVFDCIALTRNLDLYENHKKVVCATFGKKISNNQLYKIQQKGIEQVILAYDGDAVEATKKIASTLQKYFQVRIADIPYADKDWDELNIEETKQVLSSLKKPMEYKLRKLPLWKQ